VLQDIPQLVPSHVGLALAVVVHAVHEAPQLAVSVLLTQALPQRWYPALHTKPQPVVPHVAVAFAGAVQCVQVAPHAVASVLLAQPVPHA
jgi:hypothetical protein